MTMQAERRMTKACGATVLLAFACACAPASAETMSGALSRAYRANPDLNQQRAGVRATDENLPRARAGWMPRLSANATYGRQYTMFETNTSNTHTKTWPRTYGATASQTLFDGFRTLNSVRQAESQVFGARETMRVTEQTVLLSAATAYMNVLRDTAILNLRRNNISVLEEQVRQTRVRFQVGEVTRTDVAQAEAALAQANSDASAAQAALQASIASYRQFVGAEPKNLAPARPVEALLPKKMSIAVDRSQVEHPAIASALHNADAAQLAVKVAESALYPTATVSASVTRNLDLLGQQGNNNMSMLFQGQLNVPLYQGGGEYASIRQAKEQAAQARLAADLARDQVRALVVTSWGQLEAAKAQLISGQAAVTAAEIALNGIREEAKVGQRTTFDVLTAQQTLLNTRVILVTAQRDRVVASYAVLSAMGELSAGRLGLTAQLYDPTIHFDQVKKKLIGTSTPDGR